MPYVPDPNDVTAPLDTEIAESAAAEFRALKTHVKNTITSIQITGDPFAPDRMNWTGDYDPARAYIKNDITTSGSVVYICLVTNTGELLTDPVYWDVMLQGIDEQQLLTDTKPDEFAGNPSIAAVTLPSAKLWLRDTVAENFPFSALPNPAMGHVKRPKAVSYTDLFTCWLNEKRQVCVRGNCQLNHLDGSSTTGAKNGVTVINNFSSKYGRLQTGDRFMQLHGTFSGMFALTEKGDIFFCGIDADGLNGTGTSGSMFTWTKVPYVGAHVTEAGLPVDIIAMHVGWDSSYNGEPINRDRCVFAIDSSKRLWSWGNGTNGQLGHGDNLNKLQPTLVTALTDIEMVSSTGYFTAVTNSVGDLFTFGDNDFGALGTADTVNKSSPVQITGSGFTITSPVKQILTKGFSGGVLHILTEDGNAYGTGYNIGGQIGDGTIINKTSLTRSGTQSFSSLYSAGNNNSSVWALAGTPEIPTKAMWAWGYNNGGQVGQGDVVSPIQIPSRPLASTSLANTTTVVNGAISQIAELFGRDDVDLIMPINELAAGNTQSVIAIEGKHFWFWGYNYGLDTEDAISSAGAIHTPTAMPSPLNTQDGYDGTKARIIVDFGYSGQSFASQGVFILQMSDGRLYGIGYNGANTITDNTRVIDQFTPMQQ